MIKWITTSFHIFGLSLAVAGQVYAHGGDPNLIHSCVNNDSGEIKLIAPSGTCQNNTTPVDWDKAARTTPGTFTVNCNAGETIGGALKNLIPGDALLVSGTCNENVAITGSTSPASITIDGQGNASINGPDSTQATVRITRGGITIRGFTITGGRDGIRIQSGGTATISGNTVTGSSTRRDGIVINRGGEATADGNIIQNWGRFGINMDQNGAARIINNTIQGNSDHGILVGESSSARIGFETFSDTTPGPNTIQNNGGRGVQVTRSASALILSNTISNNGSDGIGILRVSHADVGANLINSNNGSGIVISGNSGVNFGQTSIAFDGANSTTANNANFGIECTINSYAQGSRGTIGGANGQTSFSGNCANNTAP